MQPLENKVVIIISLILQDSSSYYFLKADFVYSIT